MADLIPGSGTISKIYAGSSEVQKIYAGTTLVYEVGGAAVDWDTYANGIWWQPYFIDRDDSSALPTRNGVENFVRSHYLGTAIGDYSQYDMTVRSYPIVANQTGSQTGTIGNWGDDSGRIVTTVVNSGTATYTQGVEVPWGWALYSITDGEWKGYAAYSSTGSNRHFTTPAFITGNEHTGDRVILVSLSGDPGNAVTEWRDYDGPDDWDTWEDGIEKSVTSGGINYSTTLIAPTTGSINYTIGSFGASTNYIRCVGLPNDGTYPFVALWNIDTGAWGLYEYQGVGDTYYDAGRTTFAFHSGTPVTGIGVNIVVVVLTRQPSDITAWRDYDGPLYAGWDDPDWSYVGRAAGAGNDSSLGTYAIPIGFSEGSLVGCETHARSNTYEWTQYGLSIGKTDRYFTYGTRYQVFYTQRAGWQRRGPVASQWSLANAPTYPVSLDYGSFYLDGPTVAFDSAEDPGQVDSWPDYDGPVANWDTYANGVYVMEGLGTGTESVLVSVPAYPTTTYDPAMDDDLRVVSQVGVRTNFNTPAQNADSPQFIAVYVHQYHDDQGGYFHNAKGWYVFERPAIPATNNSMIYTPYAWPGDTSTGTEGVNLNDDGFLLSGGNDTGFFVVFLDEYNDPVGAGGTDHWTAPPYFIYNSAPVHASGRIYPDQGSGTIMLGDRETHCDVYTFGMVRDQTPPTVRFLVESHSAYGNADYEVYANGTLYMQGVVNLSVATGGVVQSYDTVESGFTGTTATDFNVVSGVGDPVFILVYTDTSKPQ